MRRELIFPTLLIVLYAGAAVVAVFQGDWRRVTYWVCAAGLNAAVAY